MAPARSDGTSYAHVGATLATGAGAALFAWNQNRGDVVGGPIHWAKAAWLHITILNFLVLPALWWRRSNASPPIRRLMQMLALQFAVRGAIELPMIYATRWWKCGYGISHDALVFALLGHDLIRSRGELDLRRDRNGLAQVGLSMALLAVEGYFARLFRSVQDPVTGIYFADDSPRFRHVIRVTRRVVLITYPIVGVLLWTARRDLAGTARR